MKLIIINRGLIIKIIEITIIVLTSYLLAVLISSWIFKKETTLDLLTILAIIQFTVVVIIVAIIISIIFTTAISIIIAIINKVAAIIASLFRRKNKR
jgi:hypothetical protein